jgi:uncharacterized membrane protein
MTFLAIARALHVLAIVVWIGGVATVTLILFPAIRSGAFGPHGHKVFQAVESRFVWYARVATVLVGVTGFYMVDMLGAWDRFKSVDFWWMHAMVCVWLIFTLLLFLIEPLLVHRRLAATLEKAPGPAVARLHALHWVLLVLSLITIAGAVLGSQGVSLSDVIGGDR